MEIQEKEELKKLIVEVLQSDLIKPYYVDKEQHYQDHLFIKSFHDWCEETKSTFWKMALKGILGIVGILMIGGFIYWLKTHTE